MKLIKSTGRLWSLIVVIASCLCVSLIMPTASVASPSLDSEEIEFCRLINEHRAAKGLQPLLISQDLNEASDFHSDDMALKNYLSHTDSRGKGAYDRIVEAGYNYPTYWGENIAAGNSTASGTFTQWKNSAPHNANMLSANFKVMGIARSYSATSTYKWYWNNTFGGHVDGGATACGSGPAPSPTPTPTPTPSPSPSTSLPSAVISDTTVAEGSSGTGTAGFIVRLSKPATAPVTVSYSTANGTATSGSDYFARTGTLTIGTGQTNGTIPITIIRDRVREPNETFFVRLASPVNATLADSSGTGNIINDD